MSTAANRGAVLVPFELRVEFAGLCLYVIDPGGKKVTIVMPDARDDQADVDELHDDGEIGEAHAGYLRFDLANLDAGNAGLSVAPSQGLQGASGSPRCEVVHRFSRQQLEFLLPNGQPLPEATFEKADPGVPRFDDIGPSLQPATKTDFADAKFRGKLLMTTEISGGSLLGEGTGKTWAFSPVLGTKSNGNGNGSYSGQFAGFSVWRREIADATGVMVRITDVSGSAPPTTIPLVPKLVDGKPVIALKVANLCAHNPLEWDEFSLRTVVSHDLDFKWLYRMLKPATGNFASALAGAEFPFPRALPNQAYGDEDCMGGSIVATFK